MRTNPPPITPAFITLAIERLEPMKRSYLREHAKRHNIPRGRTKRDTILNLIKARAVDMDVWLCIP